MKVVLFAGGQGLRLREYGESVPKPMAPIGPRPVLWHVMRYYAHFGYRDFIVCLGYKAEVVKEYFLNYNEAISNDFVLTNGGSSVEFLGTDIQDWRITFINTGLNANIGQRLRAVQRYVGDEEVFLANYSDVLTDAPLDELVADFRSRDKIAAFLAVKPSYTFHVVSLGEHGLVSSIEHVRESGLRINGGFFMFRPRIFDFIGPGDELVEKPFDRLISEGQLIAYPYDGFWVPMDTLKDMQNLEALYGAGRPPWAVWQRLDPA
ncbi:MAG TPA: sugar phosphate nucleotidyltransferase [Candidatus Limnocylindrales bacterium]